MKLHLERGEGSNIIRGYEPGQVTINEVVYTCSLVVMPDRVVENWGAADVKALGTHDFEALATLGAEVVLLGTGARLTFPAPATTAALYRARIGLEVMDTAAACRTYNILMGEGRNVAAALLIGDK